MLNVEKYCEYLYPSLFIPIYVYRENALVSCYPEQDIRMHPPKQYISSLLQSQQLVTYTITTFNSYYGYVQLESPTDYIIIGPINDFHYTDEALNSFCREYAVMKSDMEAFSEFFRNIPPQHLDTFLNTLLSVNYVVNNTALTRKDISDSDGTFLETSMYQKYSEEVYAAKEEGILNTSYQIETELVRHVETGNLEGIRRLTIQAKNTRVGVVAQNNLRQFKNIFIVLVTLISRAAMKGGLSPSIVYSLTNIYMQQVERLTDIEAIMALMSHVQVDFTNRVANAILPVSSDNVLYKVIQYVHANTNKNLTVEDIAEHINFSRSYLSRKFKKELGFDLSSFIRRCKLEESKDLLQFSDKSISDISNYLCFSSQSHFQKAFKNQYGITPQVFRKSV